MNLQDQVCSLEQAKRLQELGLRQEGIFLWLEYSDHRTFHGQEYIRGTRQSKVLN
jgi:hypothetical protein